MGMHLPRRARADMRAFALAAFGLVLVSASPRAAEEAAQGEALAKRWCAACHDITADRSQGGGRGPAFATLSGRRNLEPDRFSNFMLRVHRRVPGMQLTQADTVDLRAYITGLAK